jgi:hypothetical protein
MGAMWAKVEHAMQLLEELVELAREIRDEMKERRGTPSV